VAHRWARVVSAPQSYFDVVGDVPHSVVYNDGGQDLLGVRPPACPMPRPGSSDTRRSNRREERHHGFCGAGDLLAARAPVTIRAEADSGVTGVDGGGVGGAPGARENGAGRRSRLSPLGEQVVADARPVSSNGCRSSTLLPPWVMLAPSSGWGHVIRGRGRLAFLL
jgi:hypothetical protein